MVRILVYFLVFCFRFSGFVFLGDVRLEGKFGLVLVGVFRVVFE